LIVVIRRPNLRVEKELLRTGTGVLRLAAMDEVGRGALAGPVTVGVVVVTAAIGRVPPGLRDSKQNAFRRLRADTCPAVQRTVVMAMMRVVDE